MIATEERLEMRSGAAKRAADLKNGAFEADARGDYSLTPGRWAQQEPAGYVDGMNLYEYVRSSPASLSDAEGTAAASQPTTQPSVDLGIQLAEFDQTHTFDAGPHLYIRWTGIPSTRAGNASARVIGYIVQHVIMTRHIEHAETHATLKKYEDHHDYYEYWIVKDDGAAHPIQPRTPHTANAWNDDFEFGHKLPCTIGSFRIQGWAKFTTEKPPFGENVHYPPGNRLPSSKFPPSSKWSDAGAVYHELSYKWESPRNELLSIDTITAIPDHR